MTPILPSLLQGEIEIKNRISIVITGFFFVLSIVLSARHLMSQNAVDTPGHAQIESEDYSTAGDFGGDDEGFETDGSFGGDDKGFEGDYGEINDSDYDMGSADEIDSPTGVRNPSISQVRRALQELKVRLKTANTEVDRKAATLEIRVYLIEYFDRDMKVRQAELAAVKRRVNDLEELLGNRVRAKRVIIESQLDTTIREAQGLGFFRADNAISGEMGGETDPAYTLITQPGRIAPRLQQFNDEENSDDETEFVSGVVGVIRTPSDALADAPPQLIVDIKNLGDQTFKFSPRQEFHESEIDGVWYRWTAKTRVLSGILQPGASHEGIDFVLDPKTWGKVAQSSDEGESNPLQLKPGVHSIRVRFALYPAEGSGPPLRVVTKPVRLFITSLPR